MYCNFLLWQNVKKLLQGVLVGSSLGLSYQKIHGKERHPLIGGTELIVLKTSNEE